MLPYSLVRTVGLYSDMPRMFSTPTRSMRPGSSYFVTSPPPHFRSVIRAVHVAVFLGANRRVVLRHAANVLHSDSLDAPGVLVLRHLAAAPLQICNSGGPCCRIPWCEPSGCTPTCRECSPLRLARCARGPRTSSPRRRPTSDL